MELAGIVCLMVSWAWITKFIWPHEIEWKEMAIQIAVTILVVVAIWGISMSGKTTDTELWNGSVLKKYRDRVSCSHSYSCNCRSVTSGSGKNATTTIVCDTCYEHDCDYDWVVQSDYGDNVCIDRVDRRGTSEPPRFTKVKIGEPFSSTHYFTNYIKAVPDSLFNDSGYDPHLNDLIPPYPRVRDYYRVNRAIRVATKNPEDINKWNAGICEIASRLGPKLQVNPLVIFVGTADQSYIHAIEKKWIGGKKNDVTIIFGIKNYPKIDWVAVMSWDNEELKIDLRNRLTSAEFDGNYREFAIQTIDDSLSKHFKRMKMSSYEYLKDEIEPTMAMKIFALIVGIVVSSGLSYFFYKNEF